MVELTQQENEIKKLLKKMEDKMGIYHLTPTEIHKIINKRGLLAFLKKPKGKHVVWNYADYVEYDLHRATSINDFYSDLQDFVNIKFTGKWSTHN